MKCWSIRPWTGHFIQFVGNDTGRHCFSKPCGNEDISRLLHCHIKWTFRARHDVDRFVLGDSVISVDPREFLDQIDFSVKIVPPSGRRPQRVPVSRIPFFATNRGKNSTSFGVLDIDPKNAADLAGPERNGGVT
jgi:hypothetical protein